MEAAQITKPVQSQSVKPSVKSSGETAPNSISNAKPVAQSDVRTGEQSIQITVQSNVQNNLRQGQQGRQNGQRQPHKVRNAARRVGFEWGPRSLYRKLFAISRRRPQIACQASTQMDLQST